MSVCESLVVERTQGTRVTSGPYHVSDGDEASAAAANASQSKGLHVLAAQGPGAHEKHARVGNYLHIGMVQR